MTGTIVPHSSPNPRQGDAFDIVDAVESRIQSPSEMLAHWAETRPDDVYLRQPRGGRYHDLTWLAVRDLVRRVAGGLRGLGLAPGDRVALLSKNCAEWFLTDLAMMLGGYVSVPIFPTANAQTIRYCLAHSEAKAIFLGKLDRHPDQEAGVGDDILRIAFPYDTMPAKLGWEELLQTGEPLVAEPAPDPDRVMTIIYTSGSTGRPKGVVHTVASLSWAGHTVKRDLCATERERVLSYLPLAHITERAYIEIASLYTGGTVAFVESMDTFVDDVKRARPTLFLAVPRLWTLFRQNILTKLGRLVGLCDTRWIGGLLKRKVRSGLGLSHARILGCGSAPVPPVLLEWYLRMGFGITEAWGMTENCAYATLNYPFDPGKIGSVGRAGIDCEVAASDRGELLFKSPGLMTGYYKDPEATAAAFTDDGFFRTGDLCRIDEDGYVYITGRVKDIFKTAKGKYVAPVPIENDLAGNPAIEQACVVGSTLPQPIALVQPTDEARSRPREEVRASLESTLRAINSGLESHQKLDVVLVVSEPWSTHDDTLTPTLKIKRHVLDLRFGKLAEGIRGGQVRWEDEL